MGVAEALTRDSRVVAAGGGGAPFVTDNPGAAIDINDLVHRGRDGLARFAVAPVGEVLATLAHARRVRCHARVDQLAQRLDATALAH